MSIKQFAHLFVFASFCCVDDDDSSFFTSSFRRSRDKELELELETNERKGWARALRSDIGLDEEKGKSVRYLFVKHIELCRRGPKNRNKALFHSASFYLLE